MRRIVFLPKAFDDFTNWATEDKQVYRKLITLIQDVQRNPLSGCPTKFTEFIVCHSVNFVNSVEKFLYNEQEFSFKLLNASFATHRWRESNVVHKQRQLGRGIASNVAHRSELDVESSII